MSNILIVDDEQSYRQLLSLVFEGDGHTIRTAANGVEALQLLKDGPADVVISDVRMPDMDGITLLRSVKEISPDIGVILITAFGTINVAREAFKLGADDIVQKPFNNEELKLIVERADGSQTFSSEGRPIAIVSNVMIEYRPAPPAAAAPPARGRARGL